jgi:hypothetical protein
VPALRGPVEAAFAAETREDVLELLDAIHPALR